MKTRGGLQFRQFNVEIRYSALRNYPAETDRRPCVEKYSMRTAAEFCGRGRLIIAAAGRTPAP